MPVWKIALTVPSGAAPHFDAALEALLAESGAVASAELPGGAAWCIEAYLEAPPPREQIEETVRAVARSLSLAPPAVAVEELADRDWVSENQRSFQPFQVGRFFVHPAHWSGTPPDGLVGLLIDPGMAFGTGTHATTQGCLQAIDALAGPAWPRRAIDLGCGSGILAIALAKLTGRTVLASDNDSVAVRIAQENAAVNGVAGLIEAVEAEGFDHPEIGAGAPYDMIVANILAQPLIALAGDVARHLAADGRVILSGLLAVQAAEVMAAYARQGLGLAQRIDGGEWSTLVLRR